MAKPLLKPSARRWQQRLLSFVKSTARCSLASQYEWTVSICCLKSCVHVSHSSLSAQAPGLAVVLVGSRKDSETYVRNKKKACEEVGIASFGETLSEDATEEEVLKV